MNDRIVCPHMSSILFRTVFNGNFGEMINRHVNLKKEMAKLCDEDVYPAGALHITGGFGIVGEPKSMMALVRRHDMTNILSVVLSVQVKPNPLGSQRIGTWKSMMTLFAAKCVPTALTAVAALSVVVDLQLRSKTEGLRIINCV